MRRFTVPPFRMLDRDRAEEMFLAHLDWIDKVAASACARHGVWGADAEDFTSWMRIQLMEDDYAVLRKFRGDSRVTTYLATVVARNLLSYVRSLQGEWRPSAAAERLGSPARDLERLVRRDRYTVQQAGEVLRTAGLTTLSDTELARLLAHLPVRSPLRPVELQGNDVLHTTPGGSHADQRVVAAESETRRAEIVNTLDWALGELEPVDRLIAKMHFGEGRTLADVARALNLEQKPLYRRVQRLRTHLRTLLETAGLREEDVRGALFEPESP